uniref:DNL-type domain-containing protein n=1 Tax=Triticum aestivum TaxID=4565 RepID=A0A3B6EGM0_WHEAT
MATTATGYGCSAALSQSHPTLTKFIQKIIDIHITTPISLDSSWNEASFDIKLPRRSLLVQFTCNKCDARTKRLINRVAYERGTVFLQCAGCQVYHKFVDNLGLIVEYDLREENGVNTCTED